MYNQWHGIQSDCNSLLNSAYCTQVSLHSTQPMHLAKESLNGIVVFPSRCEWREVTQREKRVARRIVPVSAHHSACHAVRIFVLHAHLLCAVMYCCIPARQGLLGLT